MYDPFDNLEKLPDASSYEVKPLTMYDPYANLEKAKVGEGEERLPFKPYEESTAATLLDTIPMAKYLLPEEQNNFYSLSEDEQRSALAWQAAGVALLFAGGPLLKGGARAASSVIRSAGKRALPILSKGGLPERLIKAAEAPIEDTLMGIDKLTKNYKVKPFNYEESLTKQLRGQAFGKGEIEAIAEYKMTGNRGKLRDAVLNRSFEKQPMTKRWNETVSPTREPYGGFTLKSEVESQLSEEALRAKHYKKQYQAIYAREVLGTRQKDLPKELFERTFQKQMAAKYPEEGIKHSLDNITERDFADFISDMLTNKREYRSVLSATGGRFWPAALTPTRMIYGAHEASWGAYSGVYKPLRKSFENARGYTFDRTLTWHQMLKQRGLGDIEFSKYGDFSFKPAKEFTAQEADKAYSILRQIDNIAGNKELPREMIDKQISSLVDTIQPESVTRKVIDAWRDFSDTLYGEFLIHKVPSTLRKDGALTPFGQNSIDALTAKITPKLLSTFSSSGSRASVQKMTELRQVLDEVKGLLKPTKAGKDSTHPWFNLSGKTLDDHVDKLTKELTLSNDKGKLIGYTEHYTARISGDQERHFEKWSQALVGRRGGFEKRRVSEQMMGEPVDFRTMIESRIHSQANAMFLYPTVDEVVKTATKFPTHLASYVEHHLARVLNMPSTVDHHLARMFENTVGKVEQLFGKEGTWSPRRVMNLAQTVTDLTYLGGLGFKPFSAARNLFQPLVTVPADLGGLKDYAALAKGYANARKPEVRKYLSEIGIITEYAPEISLRPKALPFAKTIKVGNREFATDKWDSLKDAAMWMFKASDRFNRYVTGAAAMNKWDGALAKFPQGINNENMKQVLKATGVNQRNPWMKNEIEDLLRRGKLDDAKASFIRDVVSDTQFLYSAIDSPTIIGRGGSVGKTGLIFQSYWMNLGPALEKWASTGTMSEKGQKLLTWTLAQAAAYQMMEPVWGARAAGSAVGFGPFPTQINEYMIPAPWTPIYRALGIVAGGFDLNPEMMGDQAKKLLKSSAIFVPGGLQAAKSFRGFREEGFEGFAKSIVGYPLSSQSNR